jgi:predicted phage baseplate assembly protein
VYGNLADADEGKTMPEVPLGSGDATQVFQNFKVPKPPLTYHIVPENTPTETPELEIHVDGRLWTHVDSFFNRRADEQIYIVREDADGNSWAQFGDGKTGARLPSGVQNVTALYRMGSGSFGPLKADTKAQASAKLKNLDKVLMPAEASGGAPAEDGDNARNAAPGKVQSLGRIVSMKDFETEASAVPGVALASAMWQLVDGIPTVVVTVLMETGRSSELTAVRETLDAYNKSRGAGLHPIDVVPGKRMYVTATIEYALKPTYRADVVEPAILLTLGVNHGGATRDEDQSGLFSLRRRRFGRAEYASSIEGTVQNVDGVLWARVTAFDGLNDSDDPATIVLPATSVLEPVVGCDSNFVLSLFDQHVSLAAVAEVGT